MLRNAVFLAGLTALSNAHSIFLQLEAGGTTYPISYAIADPSYDGPIQDVTTNYIACNGGPNPTTRDKNIINVKAGDTVQAVWRHTLTSTEANDPVYVIDPSHKGPTMAYLKKVDDATTDVGYGPGWFKIQEAGYNAATQDWAITDLIANDGYQAIKIPSCIEDGQYLLRAELLALHAASSPGGAQFYMECAQINVSGGSGSASPATVSFPGAYNTNDPGILINIYQNLPSYTIPGPPLFTCPAGGGSPPPPPPPHSSTTLATTTRGPTTTRTTTKVTTTTGSTGGSPLYGQCGGQGWTGPTTCAQGTCKVSNQYYSQCLP
ncbi:putative endo-beta-1,4-glucanase D [Xylogone sp. PMI_703]|nr:putative endo-beta-1,4-glucanase D [Xylogone sp. PMI_703]